MWKVFWPSSLIFCLILPFDSWTFTFTYFSCISYRCHRVNAINCPSSSFYSTPLVIVLIQSLFTVGLHHCNIFLMKLSALKPALIILTTSPHPTHNLAEGSSVLCTTLRIIYLESKSSWIITYLKSLQKTTSNFRMKLKCLHKDFPDLAPAFLSKLKCRDVPLCMNFMTSMYNTQNSIFSLPDSWRCWVVYLRPLKWGIRTGRLVI